MVEDVSSRLTTYAMLDDNPPAFRVSWVAWDSAFRDTDLRPGDRIVAVDGQPVTRPERLEDRQRMLPKSIGQYQESQAWAEAGVGAGTKISLTVRRRNRPGVGWQTLEVPGNLRPPIWYENAEGRRALAPEGPDVMANDGFPSSWGAWYEQEIVPKFTAVLEEGWQARHFISRFELEEHRARKARVDYLAEHYPGPFADAVVADWEAVRAYAEGDEIVLPPEALQYRRAGDERVEEVRIQAQAAWDAFQKSVTDTTVVTFPAVHPIRGDREAVIGRHVVLPPLANRDWINQAGHTWFVAGNDQDGWYFVDAEAPPAQAMLVAMRRYTRLVSPNIDETYAMIGRVNPEPHVLVIDDTGHFGLQLEPVAALVGNTMFVDLTRRNADGAAAFAGEEAFMQPSGALPPADATPAQVVDAMVTAVKEGDLALWKSLFAPWWVDQLPDGRPVVHPNRLRVNERDWELSRRSILGRVVHAQVSWTGDPRPVTDGSTFAGAPRIEEVDVELDHYGEFDGRYRVFNDITINRQWQLQRIDGGPWRITSMQSL